MPTKSDPQLTGRELDLRLAERFWVTCPEQWDINWDNGNPDNPPKPMRNVHPHPKECSCQGTGKLWPLRWKRQCHGAKHNSSNSWPCKNGMLQWHPSSGLQEIPCPNDYHQGPGWVPNLTYDNQILGYVLEDKGLRGEEAIKVALLRALEEDK